MPIDKNSPLVGTAYHYTPESKPAIEKLGLVPEFTDQAQLSELFGRYFLVLPGMEIFIPEARLKLDFEMMKLPNDTFSYQVSPFNLEAYNRKYLGGS